jgi:FkbM family methyltransferase
VRADVPEPAQAPAPPPDRLPEQLVWRAIRGLPTLLGLRCGRALAAQAMRVTSITERGYLKNKYRVAAPAVPTPGLLRLPQDWWERAPRLRARRLGLHLDLDLRDNLQRTIYFVGTYERSLIAFLARELRHGDVFADVGAHVGLHALLAARRLHQLGSGTVVAFEPSADSAAALRRAAAANRLALNVVESGLGRSDGRIELFADPGYGVADAGVRSQYGIGARVHVGPVMAFDGWARRSGLHRLDLAKIDVEGAEHEVLAGMTESLRRFRPRAVVVEVKARIMERAGVTEEAVRRLLADCRYYSTGQILESNEVFRPRH